MVLVVSVFTGSVLVEVFVYVLVASVVVVSFFVVSEEVVLV